MTDDITAAVLAREEVARYLLGADGEADADAHARVLSYLDELRTTQRYPFYKALKHPFYPIFRKIERIDEHLDRVVDATSRGHVVYVSNHKSHLDYLIEALALLDNGIRPPVIAAGINLFGGPLGIINRHVTGAIPIRRNSKDPAYLVTLKAYVAELLQRQDLLFYPEGGRSYSGELKPSKMGLLHAALQADRSRLLVVPMAIAYDFVLEDRALVRQGTKRRQRPFRHELAEMVGLAVGYQSRAFVTFGEAIPLMDFDPENKRDIVRLAHRIQAEIGRLYKVTPTAILSTVMRPSLTRPALVERADALIRVLESKGANLAVRTGRRAVDDGIDPMVTHGILAIDRDGQLRVRNRLLLRYYARTIRHLVGDLTFH
ncbi:MAG: 1-acyl-sn-glycerol-3-phosphate acyltransferase [Acidobacteriota bacterium]|nr:1-acyl-sn-glycerol-3-phosphate acyltransferase [Acidobacteriota bacterium]